MERITPLDDLRRILLDSQERGVSLPSEPDKQVVVDRFGNIILGGGGPLATRTTSQVPQDTFAGQPDVDRAH